MREAVPSLAPDPLNGSTRGRALKRRGRSSALTPVKQVVYMGLSPQPN